MLSELWRENLVLQNPRNIEQEIAQGKKELKTKEMTTTIYSTVKPPD